MNSRGCQFCWSSTSLFHLWLRFLFPIYKIFYLAQGHKDFRFLSRTCSVRFVFNTNLKLIFLYSKIQVKVFIYLVPTLCIEKTLLCLLDCIWPFVKKLCLFLGFLFCLINLSVYPYIIIILFWYCGFPPDIHWIDN